MTFKSEGILTAGNEKFKVIGELTLTCVQRSVTMDASEAYAGPVYGDPTIRTETREASPRVVHKRCQRSRGRQSLKMYRQLIKIEARGAQLESSGLILRRHLEMRPFVTSGGRLAKTRPLDHNPGSLSYDRSERSALSKGRSEGIIDQVGRILPRRFWAGRCWHWNCNRGG
jgi:hypothetical protein